MSETKHVDSELDLDSSPFEAAPIEGMPYERGSVEDQAIQRILEESRSEDEGPKTP